MTPEIQYYALIAIDRDSARTPSGLARRIYEPDGPLDQTLRRDLNWMADSAIVEWEYGDLGADVMKISESDAARLRDAFRARWSERS